MRWGVDGSDSRSRKVLVADTEFDSHDDEAESDADSWARCIQSRKLDIGFCEIQDEGSEREGPGIHRLEMP